MKKLAIIMAAVLVAFLIGLVGVYFALPSLDPEHAEQARQYVDSLAALQSDSLALDSTATDSTLLASIGGLDSLFTPDFPLDSLWPAAGDSTPDVVPVPAALIMSLRDSARVLQERLARSTREIEALNARIAELETAQEKQTVQRAEVAELSAALTKMEDKELRAIMQRLNGEVLTLLYEETSSRNRTRLLQSMPPDRAARFVHNLLQIGDAMATPVEQAATDPEPNTANQ